MSSKRWAVVAATALATAGSAVPRTASACGGFFCSQAQPVNQAAERIVFAHNANGTVTAVIEIMYEGPSENFSWLLPISSVPEGDQIAVASKISFDRLQSATNPQYSLTTRVEGTCDTPPPVLGVGGATSSGGPPANASGGGSSGPGGVTVEASGVVGAFEWTAISLDPELNDPAEAAVTWLGANGYDVPEGAPGMLGPYLEDGMYLLALRLQKGADTGSIRPIALTYEASRPMIPIKLTAVAANADMGVMTWILGDAQAVPQNYYALELNEARINWFNANSTYNSVVIAAADEAGGQGFVTEYAQPGAALANVTWTEFDEITWDDFSSTASMQGENLVLNAMGIYGGWDGFWDVVRSEVTLPEGVTIEQLQMCSFCGYGPLEADPTTFVAALESQVIEPAHVVQQLLDAHQKVTRLYTTMSAEEMTVDPLFTFNASLDDLSNLHTAERVIECGPGYYEFNAPWRIELPQGGVVRGGPSDIGQWPTDLSALPANRRILRQGETGVGRVLEDNSDMIDQAVETYSASVPEPPTNAEGGSFGLGGGAGTSAGAAPGNGVYDPGGGAGRGCGCVVAGRKLPSPAWALLGLVVLAARRRRDRTR